MDVLKVLEFPDKAVATYLSDLDENIQEHLLMKAYNADVHDDGREAIGPLSAVLRAQRMIQARKSVRCS